MATFPNENRQYIQPNRGQFSGNVFTTYGMDLTTQSGLAKVSAPVKKVLNTADDPDPSDIQGAAGGILEYLGSYYATFDKVFSSTRSTINWSQTTTSGDEFNANGNIADAVVFDDLLLVSAPQDIHAFDGSSWSLWWTSTLGASALAIGTHLMEVGPDRNLYLTNIDKLYKVDVAGTETISGDGTLDYSATPYDFTCLESNSTRLWIGTENTDGGEAIIIEWDMSPTSTAANREHRIGSDKVMCIAIWNDTPIALLRNGKIKYFNGSSFVDMPGVQLPSAISDVTLRDDFVHFNGWAIIDNLPHFLLNPALVLDESSTTFKDYVSNLWNMPAGVWCVDPDVGMYCRFPVGSGASTQDDYGHPSLSEVGALYAVESPETKFLASYRIHTSNSTTDTILGAHDQDRTQTRRALFATTFYSSLDNPYKQIELFFKKLQTGEEIRPYYRDEDTPPVTLTGTWYSNTRLNTTEDVSSISAGDYFWVKAGAGAGQFVRIESVNEGASVNEITFVDTVIGVVQNESCGGQVLDFKPMKVINSPTRISEELAIPAIKKLKKVQFLFEYRQNSGSTIEQEYCIIK